MEDVKKLENYSDVLTLVEVAEFLRVSKDTVKALVSSGILNSIRIGRLYRFKKEDIADFLEKNGR